MGNRIKPKIKETQTQTVLGAKLLRSSHRLWIVLILGAVGLVLFSVNSFAAEKIVSVNACTDELLLQFGKPERIAGVTNFFHTSPSEALLTKHPEIRRFGGNAENILIMNPSLVLAESFSNVLLLEQLKKAGIPVLVIAVPRSWEELLAAVRQISDLAGNPENSETFRMKIQKLQQASLKSQWYGKRAVFWSAAGHASGRNTFEDTILSTLGMKNSVNYEGYSFLTLEKLIELKPDVIVVTQNPDQKDSWAHTVLFHPVLRAALPGLEYVFIPEVSASCASAYTVESLSHLLENQTK